MRLRTARQLPERAFLRFEHGYSFDADPRRRYDGGVVEIKVGGGQWRGVASRFTHGGYNGRIARRTGNRLGGQRAFTGNSRGWASARVDLSDFAGRDIKVRFRMASDRSQGGRGWYIDDIRIYTCIDEDGPEGD
jgi:bacillopeptidase F (M6 metalloprotease family)